jgi:hypothetical protein
VAPEAPPPTRPDPRGPPPPSVPLLRVVLACLTGAADATALVLLLPATGGVGGCGSRLTRARGWEHTPKKNNTGTIRKPGASEPSRGPARAAWRRPRRRSGTRAERIESGVKQARGQTPSSGATPLLGPAPAGRFAAAEILVI